MQSGDILDAQITASSSFDKQSVGPQNARLHSELASGAWCPKPQINSKSYEFLQVWGQGMARENALLIGYTK